MGKFDKFRRQFFQWFYLEENDLPTVKILFDQLFEDLYLLEGQCFKARYVQIQSLCRWVVLILCFSHQNWTHLSRQWRKEWGIGHRVKGCPPPMPLGLHDFKLWREGSGRDVNLSAPETEACSGWIDSHVRPKLADSGRSDPPLANSSQTLNAVEYPNTWWSKDECNTGGLRHVSVLFRSEESPILADLKQIRCNDDSLGPGSNSFFSSHHASSQLNDGFFHGDQSLALSENLQFPITVGHASRQTFLHQPCPNTFAAGSLNSCIPIPSETLISGYNNNSSFPCPQFSGDSSSKVLYEQELFGPSKAMAALPNSDSRFQDQLPMEYAAQPAIPYLYGSESHDPYVLPDEFTTLEYTQ